MSDSNISKVSAQGTNFDWKNYQKKDAIGAAIENNLENTRGIFGRLRAFADTAIAKELTNICNQMSVTYDAALADEIEYEIENQTRSVEEIKEELIKVQKEIKDLTAKKENGTITEDEQKRLDDLNGQVGNLKSELTDAIAEECFLAHGFEEELDKQKGVRDTAMEYSDTTIDVGKDVVSKYTCFAKFSFGRRYESEIGIGNTAVKSGINLEAVVKTADEMASIAEESLQTANATADDAQGVADGTNVAVDNGNEARDTSVQEEEKPIDEAEKKKEEE